MFWSIHISFQKGNRGSYYSFSSTEYASLSDEEADDILTIKRKDHTLEPEMENEIEVKKTVYENLMVMDLCGKSLEHFHNIQRTFSVKDVAKIAIQMINILQQLQDKGIIHRDIKPDNIVLKLLT